MFEDILTQFKALYEMVQNPIQVIDEQGSVVYVNRAFRNLWDYDIGELKAYSVFDDPELRKNGIRQKIANAFSSSKPVTVDNYNDSLLRTKNILVPYFRTTMFAVPVSGRNFLVIFHTDLTETILAEEEAKKARDNNREAERLKNTFLNVLSHELRTPLNIILGYSSIIKENLKDKLDAEEKICIDNLEAGSERLFKSISQMLEFAQIEAGNYKVNIETIDLITILEGTISNVKETAEQKNLELKINFQKENVFIDADLQCVENALSNVINNAVKFTRQGFVEVEVTILEDKELAVCRIKDSGVGIDANYLDHLFNPFSQEDLNIGRNFEGNGLGLALAKRYIEKTGGSLLVDSIKGVGSNFTFTLPLSQNKASLAAALRKNLKRILMLDDSGETYDLLRAFLKNNYEIEAHSFRDFKLDLINQKDHGIIIFDVNHMHWAQSLLVCKDLKKNDALKRPLIIISSEFMDDKIKEFYEAGADKFIVKPFSKNQLNEMLEELTANGS